MGTLKGYDQLLNLVLDDVDETLRGMFPFPPFPPSTIPPTNPTQKQKDDQGNTTTRPLGLLVARGTLLTTLAPLDGSEEISNPFVGGGDGDDDGDGED